MKDPTEGTIKSTSSPTVLAVIVNWNGKDYLSECLKSIKKLNYEKQSFKVLVVDNGSTDGSLELISGSYPEAIVIKNNKNLGYVKAVNQGIKHGLSLGVDYIWIFNNDVTVKEDTLAKLIAVGEKDEKIGVVAPLVYSADNSQKVNNAGYRINYWTGWLRKLKYGKDIFKDSDPGVADVDSVLGCSNLIKTSVFRKIGLLKEVYELYFEETDFNARAKQNGFRIVIVKDASVQHKEASTMNRFLFKRAWLLLRNLFIFEFLNAGFLRLFIFIPYYFLIHVPYFLIRGSVHGIRVKLKQRKR